jgi:GNAT superfamily N-acetyltransferase
MSGTPQMIDIRSAKKAHISALGEIETSAAVMFSELDLPKPLRNETVPEQELIHAQRQGLLLVAIEDGGEPVGFAFTQEVGSILHLLELNVHPNWQRQGIGTALLTRVVLLARSRGCRSVTLTTFRHLPWNAPWYERQGFRKLKDNQISMRLRAILDQEQAKGLDPARRVAMRKELEGAESGIPGNIQGRAVRKSNG